MASHYVWFFSQWNPSKFKHVHQSGFPLGALWNSEELWPFLETATSLDLPLVEFGLFLGLKSFWVPTYLETAAQNSYDNSLWYM